MNNYEYIIASLPEITTGWKFGEKGPEDYIEEIVSLCSDKDRKLIEFLLGGYCDDMLNADFYAQALTHKDSFIKEFFRFDLKTRTSSLSARMPLHLLLRLPQLTLMRLRHWKTS